MKHPSLSLIVLLAALALPAAVTAQHGEDLPVGKQQPGGSPDAVRARGESEEERLVREKEEAVAEADGSLDGEVRAIAGPPPLGGDLAFHMAPTLAFEPRRIAPGASGTAHLVLTMQRDSVLAPGTHFEIQFPPEQAGVRLGQWRLGEPNVGISPGPFRGRPIYENYATVEIPLQVLPSTPHGRYSVRMTVIADITDGNTGAVTRRAQAPIAGELTVGPPLPTPVIDTAALAAPAAATPDADASPGVDDGSLPDGASADTATIDGVRSEPVAGPTTAAVPAAGPGELPLEEPADPVLWIAVGGGVVLLLALALFARRR